MPIASFQIDWSYDIQPPHIKRSRQDHIEHHYRRCIYLITIYLTLMGFSNIVYTVLSNGQLEVSRSLHLPCHYMSIGMSGINSPMGFF
jgi:hypothetical protein